MKKIKKTKTLSKSLELVKSSNQIKKQYYHLGNDNHYYVFKLDQYSIKNIDYFISKKIIYINKIS